MKIMLCIAALLWPHVAPSAFLFAPPRTVYHELAAPPIGETAYVNYSEYPRLSGDGSTIIYRAVTNNVTSVHVVNFDGTNDRVVDRITNSGYRAYVLNGDGTVHANADGLGSLRTGLTSVGAGTVALALDSGGINSPALSADGSKVYFCVYNNGATAVTFAPVPKGLYEANANGSGRRLIAGLGAVATVLGAPADDNIRFYFAAASATAQQLVFAVTLDAYQGTNAIMGVNRDGTGLHVIQRVGYSLRDVTISASGNTVAWGEYIAGGGNQVWSAGFDGSSARVMIPAADSPQEPLSLSTDGSDLMEGSGRIYRTYGLVYGPSGLGLRTVLYNPGTVADPVLTAGRLAMLAPSGQRGIFIGERRAYGNQVCTFEFNPAALNGAPDIVRHAVTPAYVRPAAASMATASAEVRFTGTSRGVGTVCFRQGPYENLFYLGLPLSDTGTTGDPVAGDSQFVNNQLQYIHNDPAMLGPRTLLFHAESTDANGLRHATTVEYATFFVVATTPPVSGGPTINPGTTTTTNGGRREIRFYGAGFAPERTNNVVTLNGSPLEILTASGTELLVDLPGWFADGIYSVLCGKHGQVSTPVKYRSPGLPAPVLAPLPRSVANPLTLSWTAQLRGQYSILGSANLVNWLTLTNGVPGTNTTLSVDVEPAAIGGNAKFFRVVEESVVLE